ncbi:Flp pilus assembly protein CpaB [Halomonas heilongjiangensis]|uniref:Flp pilus assembly protein CpaB n=1 Tax=Halomonas heilongjiangensis TaxID=1387883 RepID=A0A2N7TPR9_9GAMM|nr:Flp pilus assembly protein CpaB [Halomonas heilongjiangensis]PMR70179.1 Flp pilus assembly protein CpaB [Halomonas heilongjiangensis]PXX87531.1 Flp pilus assembly protein CpaB [Halomonas heilongjiangensis]
MKRKGIFAMFAISLMMALGAAVVAMNWMQEQGGEGDALADASQVVVAALQVPFGTTVQASDLKVVHMPRDVVPPNSFNDVESVVGRVSNQVIYPGEVVLEGRVSEHLGGSALAALLDPGKRAMSVRVDDVVGVAGFLLPGNRVDVLSTKRSGSRDNVESKTVLHNLKVLAVDQIASQERDGPVIVRAVTLEVTTQEAETLVKATQEGKVQLTLRNPLEKEDDSGLLAAQRSVLNVDEPEPPRASPPPRRVAPVQHQVQVIRGTQSSTVNVRN